MLFLLKRTDHSPRGGVSHTARSSGRRRIMLHGGYPPPDSGLPSPSRLRASVAASVQREQVAEPEPTILLLLSGRVMDIPADGSVSPAFLNALRCAAAHRRESAHAFRHPDARGITRRIALMRPTQASACPKLIALGVTKPVAGPVARNAASLEGGIVTGRCLGEGIDGLGGAMLTAACAGCREVWQPSSSLGGICQKPSQEKHG